MRYASLFSGVEAATLAWGPLGWEPACFAEVDPFPCAVLAERFPGVPNLGDVTKVDWSSIGTVDVVVGGSPCQSFSVAGRREGLGGESGLMFEYIRAVRDLRPRWFVWENVPGVHSIDGGRAFATLLDEMAQLGYDCAWRVLDAQFFGVAQRRRRVFLVGRLGGGGRAAAVLFERDSVRGNTVPSREKRSELAARARRRAQVAAFKYSAGSSAGSVGLTEEASVTLDTSWHAPAVFGFAQNGRDEVRTVGDGTLSAFPGAKRTTYVCELAHSKSNGLGVGESDTAPTLGTSLSTAVCQYGDVAGALTARHDSSPCADRGMSVVCVSDGQANAPASSEVCGTVSAHSRKDAPVLAVRMREGKPGGGKGPLVQDDVSGTLATGNDQSLLEGSAVRRLTPRECERLQGFPDDWTRVPYRGKPAGECPDGPRYKAIGNSMAVPVMRWIGERIEFVEGLENEEER